MRLYPLALFQRWVFRILVPALGKVRAVPDGTRFIFCFYPAFYVPSYHRPPPSTALRTGSLGWSRITPIRAFARNSVLSDQVKT